MERGGETWREAESVVGRVETPHFVFIHNVSKLVSPATLSLARSPYHAAYERWWPTPALLARSEVRFSLVPRQSSAPSVRIPHSGIFPEAPSRCPNKFLACAAIVRH